jgi:hypothetical protein
MPYIKPEARERYKELIEESVHAVMDGNEAKLVKGEYFGFLVNRLVRGYMGSADKNSPSFNSSLFNIPKQKKLLELTDKALIYLNQDEPLESAGELNYVISAVLWGIQGQMDGIEQGNYGWRCYLRGVLENIRNMMSSSTFTTTGEQRDRLKAGRRYVVALGVVNDVISECYRSVTAAYENDKRGSNGDIWVCGKLLEGE